MHLEATEYGRRAALLVHLGRPGVPEFVLCLQVFVRISAVAHYIEHGCQTSYVRIEQRELGSGPSRSHGSLSSRICELPCQVRELSLLD